MIERALLELLTAPGSPVAVKCLRWLVTGDSTELGWAPGVDDGVPGADAPPLF